MQYVYPDFNDCNRYYVCQNGQAVHMNCGVGEELDLRDFSCRTPSSGSNGQVRVTCGVLFTGLPGLQG
ncbi:hypothetical protein BaRGS_00002662 [Batillaria attramentaria]|uniref:Chitin-binding type-2 domain-containing protein n=1 Tax=Batillaria attramentaria TaxID=370345 RepID=A0ABD0M1Z3_9CAEN|nr:hypothetical protein BaRGS_007668 [Batillaria attramentaria]